MRVLSVPGYDIVLGCDWVAERDDVVINLKKGVVTLELEGKVVKLHIEKVNAEIKLIDADMDVVKEGKKGGQVFVAQLFKITEEQDIQPVKVDQGIQEIIDQYEEVFAEPQNLPPKRAVDHKITLTPNSKPINLRPYRFSHFQKLEIEKITQELLQKANINCY